MKILAKVAYKGGNYLGWQKQNEGKTIQNEIEKSLSKILNTPTVIYGSGRTDAGVHALGQTFHFEVKKNIDIPRLRYSLNCVLNNDIHIIEMKEVSDDFHARHSAKRKHYRYQIKLGENDPFLNETYFIHPSELDVESFKEAMKSFIGEHNYQDFTSKEIDEDNFVRIIDSVDIKQDNDLLTIDLIGNGFMRYMIRFMIGASIAVGEHREDLSFIKKHLDSKQRGIINYKAPSEGLFLVEVIY